MNAIVLATLIAAAEPGASLVSAYKRELALLEAERAALEKAKSDVAASRADRSKGVKKAIASLEAQLVSENAKNDALAQRIGELQRGGVAATTSIESAVDVAKATLAKRGIEAADTESMLIAAVNTIARESQVRRIDGMFFDANGRMVNGNIVEVGGIAAVSSAGVLSKVNNAVLEVAPGGGHAAALRFVDGDGPLPFLIGIAGDEKIEATQFERIGEGGLYAWVALLIAMGSLLLACTRVVWLWRWRRSARGVIDNAVTQIREGDGPTAEALCRAAGGPAGRLWSAVISASWSRSIEAVEDLAADGLVEEVAHVDRGDRFVVAGALASVALAGLVAVKSAGTILAPLEAALGLGVVLIGVIAIARALADRHKREIERGAIRLVDIARNVRGGDA